MANRHRGEASVQLAGKSYILRPSFAALVEIEERCQCGIIELAQRFFDQKVRARDVVAVLFAGIKAGGDGPDGDWPEENAVAQAVVEGGLANFIEPVGTFLADALAGGQSSTGESAAGNGERAPRSGRKKTTRTAA
ncbi:MAG: gene transfer agent family protein [Alphaproteobacteria bacterium]